jgi:hypothetical protein
VKALLVVLALAVSGCATGNVHARFYKGQLEKKMTCIFEPGGPGVLPEAKCGPKYLMDLLVPDEPAGDPVAPPRTDL